MLKELKELTGYDYKNIKFNDPEMYKAILNPRYLGITDTEKYPFPSTTMAISEMNSDFTMGVLKEIEPKNMTDMIYFSGVTHGTGSWQGNELRARVATKEVRLQDGFPVRDIIFQHLTKKFGFEPTEAFAISESVRKGKGIKKWEKELRSKLPMWMVESMEQIKYAFPKAHALSYITSALRIFWYKLNYKTEFYVSALNRYGIDSNDNKNMDFLGMFNTLNTMEDLGKFYRWVEFHSDNPTKHKNNQRLANIIYEAKLRGVKLVPATFSSHPHEFALDRTKKNTILMPLQSIKGIGESAADLISKAYEVYGETLNSMSVDELKDLKVEKNGKMVKAFGKKALEALFM
jgi:DNA polymerase-3 subunit alpha (Gram-positive type)